MHMKRDFDPSHREHKNRGMDRQRERPQREENLVYRGADPWATGDPIPSSTFDPDNREKHMAKAATVIVVVRKHPHQLGLNEGPLDGTRALRFVARRALSLQGFATAPSGRTKSW